MTAADPSDALYGNEHKNRSVIGRPRDTGASTLDQDLAHSPKRLFRLIGVFGLPVEKLHYSRMKDLLGLLPGFNHSYCDFSTFHPLLSYTQRPCFGTPVVCLRSATGKYFPTNKSCEKIN